MKHIALIVAIVLLVTGCANSLSEEALSTQANYQLRQSIVDSIALMSEQTDEEFRPHHYGEFDAVMFSPASRAYYETTLKGLEYRATNIVRALMVDDATISLREDGAIFGRNFVSINITEVIVGDLTTGETIRIVEPYFIHDGVFYTWDDYMPSIPHQEYIFFLGAQISNHPQGGLFNGAFWVVHGERSRFPMPSGRTRASVMHYLGDDGRFDSDTQNFGSALFGLGERASVDTYSSLWQEVMNEYVLPTLTGIDLRPGEIVMTVGEMAWLTEVVLPATDFVMYWESSNEDVVTVDAGTLIAISAGTATITAITADGQEATSEVLVIGGDNPNIGDVNGDGVVDFLDVLVLIYYLDNNGNISDDVTFIRENADLNGDGVIDDRDLEILFNFLDSLG